MLYTYGTFECFLVFDLEIFSNPSLLVCLGDSLFVAELPVVCGGMDNETPLCDVLQSCCGWVV